MHPCALQALCRACCSLCSASNQRRATGGGKPPQYIYRNKGQRGLGRLKHHDPTVFCFELRLDMDRDHAALYQFFQARLDPVAQIMGLRDG